MHSRVYIHLQPLQAPENRLVAFDPSIQLFIEVVEVPESGSKIFSMPGF